MHPLALSPLPVVSLSANCPRGSAELLTDLLNSHVAKQQNGSSNLLSFGGLNPRFAPLELEYALHQQLGTLFPQSFVLRIAAVPVVVLR